MSSYQTTGIVYPNDNDVLSGRGNFVNAHTGNKLFRVYVNQQREHYVATCKGDKPLFAKLIVNTIRNLTPPGRFLTQDKDTKLWSDIGDRKAWDKTRQALREKTPLDKCDTMEPRIITPAEESLLAKLGLQSSTTASTSAMKLRSMLVRQMAVATLHVSSDPWLSENVAPNNDGNMNSDKNIPVSGSPQAPSDPSTTLWGTEDISRLNLNDEEHDKSPAATDDDKGVNDRGDKNEDSARSIRDPSGRTVPLRSDFIQRPDRSNLKRNPKYSEHSLDTMSNTDLSGVTGLTDFTNISSVAGISYATESGMSYATTGTASCSSGFVPKSNAENDIDPNVFNNSLFIEGQMSEIAARLDTEQTSNRRNLKPKMNMEQDLDANTSPKKNTGNDIDPNMSNNSLFIDGQMSEIVATATMDTGLTSSRKNLTPKINMGHDLDANGLSGLTGLTDFTHISSVAGISYGTEGTASCSSGIAPKINRGNQIDQNVSNISSYLDGHISDTHPKLDRLIQEKQISGLTSAPSVSTLRSSGIAPKANRGNHIDQNVSNNSLYLDGHISDTRPKLDRSIQEKQISGLTSAPSVSTLRQSLLRTSFAAFAVDDNIGEGNEDAYNNEEDEDVEDASLSSMKTDEIMSSRSRRRSKSSMQSSLGDLSLMSGMISICEQMSIQDSGIFSMTEGELSEWQKEADDWEEDAKTKDNQRMEE